MAWVGRQSNTPLTSSTLGGVFLTQLLPGELARCLRSSGSSLGACGTATIYYYYLLLRLLMNRSLHPQGGDMKLNLAICTHLTLTAPVHTRASDSVVHSPADLGSPKLVTM